MATATPRKQRTRVRSVLLVGYGILALGLSVVLAATVLFQPATTHLSGTRPSSGISVILPAATDTALPETSATPGTGATPTSAPEATQTSVPEATPSPQPTTAPTSEPISPSTDNPFGLPLWILQVLFAFTTLSGVASILRFMWETLVRFTKLFQR